MKKLIWVIFASLAIFNCSLAHADAITGTVTGDDNVSYWNGATSSWTALGTSWPTPETVNLVVNQSAEQVYFAVSNNNWYPGGDPTGFLASFTDTNGSFVQTGNNTLVSNPANVQVLATSFNNANLPGPVPLSQINPNVDPTTLTGWVASTSYGANGTGIWESVNGAPVSGIGPDAQWVATANNTTDTYGSTDDTNIYRLNLGVVPTPEAPTLLLFAMAGGLVMFLMRRNMLRVA